MNTSLYTHVERAISNALNTACLIKERKIFSKSISSKALQDTVDLVFKENETLAKVENRPSLKKAVIDFIKHPSLKTHDNLTCEVEKDPHLERLIIDAII